MLQTLGAAQRPRLRGRRGRDLEPGEPQPTPVATQRATVIDVRTSGSEPSSDPTSNANARVDAALAVLARLVAAHRVAAVEPWWTPPSRDEALVVRVGIGDGEEVAFGRWTEARELPAPKESARTSRRASVLRPQERLAALLSGRDTALACEDLALRARLDVDAAAGAADDPLRPDAAAGASVLAAQSVDGALRAASAELAAYAGEGDLAERLNEVRALVPDVSAAARRAASGAAEPDDAALVTHALERLEAALRARTHAVFTRMAAESG